MTLVQALMTSHPLSHSSSRFNLVVCLVVIIGLVVSSAWLPHSWITPIFVAANHVSTVVARWMLYAGFIHGNYEANTLDNITELYRETIRIDRDRSARDGWLSHPVLSFP